MSFADVLRREGNFTRTENGAVALNTTGSACLDLFSVAGALREAEDARVEALFAEAYKEDPLLATKIVFYARDIREGLGERKTFRTLLRYMAQKHAEALTANLDLIGVFGRYDDLYCLVGTPLEDAMWDAMRVQFQEDLHNLHQGNAVSLMAKWIKTADASSQNTRRLGILTAEKLGYPVYNFKRMVRSLRRQIGVVEALMSVGRWDEIRYSAVPSRAMMIYRNAFQKHDGERFQAYVDKAAAGQEKINAGALYPYDIVERFMYHREQGEGARVLEAQWSQLPDYVEPGTNAIVMADVSGSMTGRPMATSIGLGIYFAERNKGAYHNMFMTFSGLPEVVLLKGETLEQRIAAMSKAAWGMNTDLKAAFDKVLDMALDNHVPQEEMPKAIIVISDMEIDHCGNKDWSFYDKMAHRFGKHGYRIPDIIFWNVNSRRNVFHADASRKGVQLCG